MAEHPMFSIIDEDIPQAQQQLRDSHGNLEKLAQYCRVNYLQVGGLFCAGLNTARDVVSRYWIFLVFWGSFALSRVCFHRRTFLSTDKLRFRINEIFFWMKILWTTTIETNEDRFRNFSRCCGHSTSMFMHIENVGRFLT